MVRRTLRESGTLVFGYMLSLLGVLAAWQDASSPGIVPMLLPSPFNTPKVGAGLWESGQLLSDIEASVLRIAAGFAAGCAVGLPAGLLMGSFRPVRQAFEPFLHFLRFLPALAWIPAAMMWLGT